MLNHVCPTCGLDDAISESLDDGGGQLLHCDTCVYTWVPTPSTVEGSDNAIHASGVGKLLRKEGLHREYGQRGPDLEKDGGPGFRAQGSAKAHNHKAYEQGVKIVLVYCDNDQTVRLVREVVEDRYGNVILCQRDNVIFLERK